MLTQKHLDRGVSFTISVVIVIIGFTMFFGWSGQPSKVNTNSLVNSEAFSAMRTFTGADDFSSYLNQGANVNGNFQLANLGSGIKSLVQTEDLTQIPGTVMNSASAALERASQTNVRVVGIDEPDVLKNDGTNLFYSPAQNYYNIAYDLPLDEATTGGATANSLPVKILPQPATLTRIIGATPPNALSQKTALTEQGNLLYDQNKLFVISYNSIVGYDVTNAAAPTKLWSVDLSGGNLVAARLWQHQLYLVTSQSVNTASPCPITPLKVGGQDYTVPCTKIYRPNITLFIDTNYTASVINPTDGTITSSLTFAGSASNNVVYMSSTALYIAYAYSQDSYTTMYSFFTQSPGAQLLPADVEENISRLNDYDIHTDAKMVELQHILVDYIGGLSTEQQSQKETEVSKALQTYYTQHLRELEHTGIAKIPLADFTISATGNIPGHLLNQYSIDENQGYLRLATTSGSPFLTGDQANTVNDIYVLDSALKITGQLQNLGLGETIYSARFVGDRGYVVTYRQTDPFYVLDLTNPKQPEMKGELKLPGFSSYLHPLTDNLILGIGQDQSKVKLSLFDVTSADQPKDLADYLLDDSWSEAQYDPHAFLQDAGHSAVFLPGSLGGYVISYASDTLTQVAKVTDWPMKRAAFINNNMYLVGDSGIVVLDENTWKSVSKFDFPK